MDRLQFSGGTNRRTVLRRGGVALAGALALAGCTEDVGEELPPNEHWPVSDLVPELPVDRRKDVLVAGIEELSTADIEDVDGFVAALEEHDIALESVEEMVEKLSVEYVETDSERRGVLEVAGRVAGTYAALVDAGYEAKALEFVFFEPDESAIGVVEIATDWAIEFNEGVLSAGEYAELVAGTIESKREPPEPDVAPDE